MNSTTRGGRHASNADAAGKHAPISAPPVHRRQVAREVTLAVGGVAGAVGVLWLIATLLFGVGAIVFKTGSMAPTIPTGSLAFERPLAAADITRGQVITVPDPGQRLPVTHRVVSVRRDPSNAAGRIVVLKGDDNAQADITPYHVTKVKLVVLSVPYLGTLIALSRTPTVLMIGTLLVAATVLWSLWPGSVTDEQDDTGQPPESKRHVAVTT